MTIFDATTFQFVVWVVALTLGYAVSQSAYRGPQIETEKESVP